MRAWQHFKTITRHRNLVAKYCFRCGIGLQGLAHDLSKYSPEEFFVSAKNYLGTRSPNEGERAEKGYSAAWMHHKGRNKHHFEYWTDYDPVTKLLSPVKMPLRYVVEMFCDRVAASRIYRGDEYRQEYPLEYFMRGKARRNIHPETGELLESLLRMLAEKGEKDTIKYIRSLLKKGTY